MNEKISMHKRIGTVVLCLALLCNVIIGTGALRLSMITKAEETAVEPWSLSFTDLPGATFAESKYANGETAIKFDDLPDTQAIDYINNKADFYFNYSSVAYTKVPAYGNAVGDDNSGNWKLDWNYWLKRIDSAGWGERLRQINAIVPKDGNGTQAQTKNLSASFGYAFGVGKYESDVWGAAVIGFRQKNPAKFVDGYKAPNQDQVLIMITRKSIGVAGGTDITSNFWLEAKDEFADTDYSDVFAEELPEQIKVQIDVIDTEAKVKIFNLSGTELYNGTFTVGYTNAGYMAFGTAATDGAYGGLQVIRRNDAGEAVDFTEEIPVEKWGLSFTDLPGATFAESKYANGESAIKFDALADTQAIDHINKKVDFYFNHAETHKKVAAYGNTKNDNDTANWMLNWNYWLKRTDSRNWGERFNNINALVPKDNNGTQAEMKNFSTAFAYNFDPGDWNGEAWGALLFGFRQQSPAKFTNAYATFNQEQVLVMLTRNSIGVAGGTDITGDFLLGETAEFTDTDYSDVFTAQLPQEIRVQIDVVDTEVKVKIFALDGTELYSGTFAVNYTESGYMAFGTGANDGAFGDLQVTRRDDAGKAVDFTVQESVEQWALSFADLPGATFTGSTYEANNQSSVKFDELSDTKAIDYISEKADFYFNHSSLAYSKVPAYGNAVGDDNSGNWTLDWNYWLKRTDSAGWGERLRQINALVPKDGNGVQAQMKNFSATFKYTFGVGKYESDVWGAALFGFRQLNPAKFVNGYNVPNKEQALVMITRKSIGVAGGTDITGAFYLNAKSEFTDTDYSDVFAEELPEQIMVKIKAVDTEVTVKIFNLGGTELYSGTFTVNYTESGYMAFGTATTDGAFGDLQITRRDDTGEAIDFTEALGAKPWALSFTNLPGAMFTDNVYEQNSATSIKFDALPDTQAIDYINNKADFYFNHSSLAYSEVPAYGNAVGDDNSGNWMLDWNYWLKRTDSAGWGERFRQINAIVPKDDNGARAELKNFSATFRYAFGVGKYENNVWGAALFGFRQMNPAKFVDGYAAPNQKQALVMITRKSIGVAGGTDLTADFWVGDKAEFTDTDYSDVFDAELPEQIVVNIKAVDTKVTVKISDLSGTELYNGMFTVNYTESGYMAFGVGATDGAFGDLQVTRRDDAGEAIDFTLEEVADPWALSFTDLPGATFTDDAYEQNGATSITFDALPDSTALDYINNKAGFYFNHSSLAYDEVPAYGNTPGDDNSGNWLLDENYWLKRTDSAGWGERLRQINAIVPKDNSGTPASLRNFSASFGYTFGAGKYENTVWGAALFGFRQKNPAKFVDGYATPNQEQALVMITRKSIGVAGGTDLTADFWLGDKAEFTDTDYSDVFAEELPEQILVNIKAVDTEVVVEIFNMDGTKKLYSGTFTVNYTAPGYMAFGTGATDGSFGNLQVMRRTGNGGPVDFDTASFEWSVSDKDDTNIFSALDENFDIYYDLQGQYVKMQAGEKKAWDEQTDNFGWFKGVQDGTWLRRDSDCTWGENMRLVSSLSPKVNGEAVTYQNFETTFKARLNDDNTTIVFGFRQKTPGKFANAWWELNKEQCLIAITKTGIVISGGENIYSGYDNVGGSITSKDGDMYNSDATATFAKSVAGEITVYVKAVGENVTVKVSDCDGSTVYYDQTVTVPYTEVGYLTYGVATTIGDLGDISLTHLDENGLKMSVDEMTGTEYDLYAESWSLSFKDLPGATFTDGKYEANSESAVRFEALPDTQALDYISEKVDFYFNYSNIAYSQVPAFGNPSGDDNSGNWMLDGNYWFNRTDSAGWGERLRQINALVPKDDNGEQAVMSNMYASFAYDFGVGKYEVDVWGAAVIGLRQKYPAKFVDGYATPNQQQVLILITRNSIGVAGGIDATSDLWLEAKAEFADTEYSDVFDAELPEQITVKIKAVDTQITVSIFNIDGTEKLYSGTFTVNYTQEGCIAFGTGATNGSYADLKVHRLDDAGNAIAFTEKKKDDTPFQDNFEGWQPAKDEWFFTWHEKYEKEIKDNTKK